MSLDNILAIFHPALWNKIFKSQLQYLFFFFSRSYAKIYVAGADVGPLPLWGF